MLRLGRCSPQWGCWSLYQWSLQPRHALLCLVLLTKMRPFWTVMTNHLHCQWILTGRLSTRKNTEKQGYRARYPIGFDPNSSNSVSRSMSICITRRYSLLCVWRSYQLIFLEGHSAAHKEFVVPEQRPSFLLLDLTIPQCRYSLSLLFRDHTTLSWTGI